jgi:hypothetical protein
MTAARLLKEGSKNYNPPVFKIQNKNLWLITSCKNYTLRLLGGRQPLCGSGVTSTISATSIPDP